MPEKKISDLLKNIYLPIRIPTIAPSLKVEDLDPDSSKFCASHIKKKLIKQNASESAEIYNDF